jgi:hypothetical protein
MWKNDLKFKGQQFKGRYNRTKKGEERVFELVNIKTGRVISFESWQMAKKNSWVKHG